VPASPVYLDNHATTRTDPRVVEAMLPYFTEHYGNASSRSHRYGWTAEEAVEAARESVAALIGAQPREIIFTSGATEANNLAIKGLFASLSSPKRHLVVSSVEHRAVLDPARRLAREGHPLTLVEPDSTGRIAPEAVEDAVRAETALVSVMLASNEVGTINPVEAIVGKLEGRGIPLHTDATQAVGKIPVDVEAIGCDLLSLSAHKFHGPKGVGALYVRRGARPIRLAPLFDGGGQERGTRSGTLAVPLIVGMGEAARLGRLEMASDAERIGSLRDRLHAILAFEAAPVVFHGHPTFRLPGSLSVGFPGVDGEGLMLALREVAVSSGSACSSSQPEPSHVLRAMGVPESLARATLRFGLSRFTTAEEVDFAGRYVADVVNRLRGGVWRGDPAAIPAGI
jgi:cysteine desulfurase